MSFLWKICNIYVKKNFLSYNTIEMDERKPATRAFILLKGFKLETITLDTESCGKGNKRIL